MISIKDIRSKKIKQVLSLYSSMILGIFFGVIVSVVNTRILGPEIYGNFKFIQSVYSFIAVIISFGFVVTISKLIAEKRNNQIRQELIGSAVIISTVIGIVFVVIMIIFALVQDVFFAVDLKKEILIISPLFFFIPFVLGFENILQGENKIYELALYKLLPQIIYIIFIIFLFKYGIISLKTAMAIHLCAFALTSLWVIYILKPKFCKLGNILSIIFDENKKYGYQVYIGSVIGVATTQLGPIVISFFSSNNIDVGYFSLALTITTPLMLIPTVVGTTMFKEFANRERISSKATKLTVFISIATLLIFLLSIKQVVILLYSEKFVDVVELAYIVAVGQILHGFGNYYNRFLGSKGEGKFLRNGAILVGVSNISGFIFIVPLFGAQGAAYTKLVSGLVYTISLKYFYNKFIKRCNID